MSSVILFTPPSTPDPAQLAALQQAGLAPQVVLQCDMLVRILSEAAPNLVVVAGAGLQAPSYSSSTSLLAQLRAALPAEQAALPCPLLLWLVEGTVDDAVAATTLGVHEVVLGPADAARLTLAAALARSRWMRERQWAAQQTALQSKLNERKWVERAKGVLMSARGMGEDEAFALLRGAAMAAKLQLADVSRSVIDAAQWADAVNRSGQLRMLSQRLVKLAAQRQAGVDTQGTPALQEEAAQRLQSNLSHLQALLDNNATAHTPLAGALAQPLRAVLAGCRALNEALGTLAGQRRGAASLKLLEAADVQAEALLEAAEALTQALDAASGRRGLNLVNLCGRQRMRVQRLAKAALLGILLHRPDWPRQLLPVQDEVEHSLRELETAPLSSPETREALRAARDEWLRMLRALHASDSADNRATLCASSDALLETFDRLTAAYEHSLQVILG